DGLVRENPNPNLAAALDRTRHRNARSFNLPSRNPTAFHGLQSEIAKRQRRAAPSLPGHAPALLLAKLHLLRHEHRSSFLTLCSSLNVSQFLLALLAFGRGRRSCRGCTFRGFGLVFL